MNSATPSEDPPARALTVMGLDLSLTSTGVAKARGGLLAEAPWTFRLRSARRGMARIDSMRSRLAQAITEISPDVIIAEGPSLHSTGAYYHEGAGWWWIAMYSVWRSGVPYAVVPPSVLKKFATGSGSADKTAMCVAAATRFGRPDMTQPDEADALWLAAAGMQHYGWPLVKLPQAQVAALYNKGRTGPVVQWPGVKVPAPALV